MTGNIHRIRITAESRNCVHDHIHKPSTSELAPLFLLEQSGMVTDIYFARNTSGRYLINST